MSRWRLASDAAELSVHGHGGRLAGVSFSVGGRSITPMHRAPWVEERVDDPAADQGVDSDTDEGRDRDLGLPPMLRRLEGDFFCAPFGESDVLPAERQPHGLTANGTWRGLAHDATSVSLELDGDVCGARVTKEVSLIATHPVVYQTHRFEGGSGCLPMGHHAMLRAPDGDLLNLSFAPFSWAGTRPVPLEPDPARGRSLLRCPQRLRSLGRALTTSGQTVDLGTYPALERSEDLVQLVTRPEVPVGWSAAVAPASGWAWFSVRPNTVLRSTLLWLSNGGRDYEPFSGRHRRVLGVEEVTACFDLGHAASAGPNPLREQGLPTCVELRPDATLEVRYAFGATPVPHGFDRVADVQLSDGRLTLADAAGREVDVPFASGFVHGG